MGYLFGICVEKNSELAKNDPARKFKGRVVFQGTGVVNQFYDAAIFQDLGSAPATLEVAKMADFCEKTFPIIRLFFPLGPCASACAPCALSQNGYDVTSSPSWLPLR